MHLTRNESPKSWPIPRKGTKYLVVPSSNIEKGIPVVVALRDILGFVQTNKEAENTLRQKKVKVNGKLIKEVNYAITLFDILSLEDKHYKMIIKAGKFALETVNEKQAGEKTAKIIGKKILKHGIIQINLNDGRNILSKEKVQTGDSIIIDLKGNTIKKILKTEKGSKVFIIVGKHKGKEGKIEKLEEKDAIIKIKDEEPRIKLENIMVIE